MNLFTDPAEAPFASAFLTFLAMGVLAAASIWLKRYICERDFYMKRAKRLIEELFSIATGVVALCFVTATQFVLLGDVVRADTLSIQIMRGRLPLAGKLAILTVASIAVVVIMAAVRTRLARI